MKQILNDERYPLSPWISKSLRKRHIRLGNTHPNKCNDSHKPSKYLPMDCFKLYSMSIFTCLSKDFCCFWNNFLSISFEKITSRMFPKGFGVDLVYLFNGYWVNLKQSLKRPRGNFNKGSWKTFVKKGNLFGNSSHLKHECHVILDLNVVGNVYLIFHLLLTSFVKKCLFIFW